jgi:hypothetical protein
VSPKSPPKRPTGTPDPDSPKSTPALLARSGLPDRVKTGWARPPCVKANASESSRPEMSAIGPSVTGRASSISFGKKAMLALLPES